MKIIKTIKLQRKLRIRQEYLCYKVCEYSQGLRPGQSPFFNEFCAANKAVRNVNKKLPELYFLLSDLFGGASLLKKKSLKYREEQDKIKIFSWDLIPSPGTPNI